MEFDNLYKDATMLTQDFLRNEFGYSIDNESDKIIYKNYYNNICSAITSKLNVFAPTSTEIEEILTNGKTSRLYRFQSLIETEQERKYLFLMAQAKQLKYDIDNGRANNIRGESEGNNICKDSVDLLDRIGLVQKVRF